MNDDFDKDFWATEENLSHDLSHTNLILEAINSLSEKIEQSQAQEELQRKRQAKKDTIFFVISTVIGLLTLGATVLFGIVG